MSYVWLRMLFSHSIRTFSKKLLLAQLFSTPLSNRLLEKTIFFFWKIAQAVVAVQPLSCVLLFAIPWTAARQSSLFFTISWSLLTRNVHWVGDVIQPSHPLSPTSPSAFSLSQHQGLFQWVSSSHQVAKALELQLQHQFFQWIFKVDFL